MRGISGTLTADSTEWALISESDLSLDFGIGVGCNEAVVGFCVEMDAVLVLEVAVGLSDVGGDKGVVAATGGGVQVSKLKHLQYVHSIQHQRCPNVCYEYALCSRQLWHIAV